MSLSNILSMFILSPHLWLLMAAGLLGLCGKNVGLRASVISLSCLLALAQIILLVAYPSLLYLPFVDSPLNLLQIHSHSFIFALCFILTAFLGGIYGLQKAKTAELVAGYVAASCAIGITFAGDLMSLVIYFEGMAIACGIIMICSNHKAAHRATLRYIYMHLLAGIILMIGAAGYGTLYDTILVQEFQADTDLLFGFATSDRHTIIMWAMLIGLLINAAAPPFSAWLPDAYPKASSVGAVFLSVFSTKISVFLLMLLFPGTPLLLYVGVIMMAYAIMIGIWEQDMRRLLCYSAIHHIGLMLVGIGVGTELALQGVTLYVLCHTLYQLVLFMSAGIVLEETGEELCHRIKERYYPNRYMVFSVAIAAMSLLAFPLTIGFISKPAIIGAIENSASFLAIMVEILVVIGALLHLKFPWSVFLRKNFSYVHPPKHNTNKPMQMAVVITALLLVILSLPGVILNSWQQLLPSLANINPYQLADIKAPFIISLLSIALFFIFFPLIKRSSSLNIDFDWAYRVAIPYLYQYVTRLLHPLADIGPRFKLALINHANLAARNSAKTSLVLRTNPIGVSVLIMGILLGVYLFYIKY